MNDKQNSRYDILLPLMGDREAKPCKGHWAIMYTFGAYPVLYKKPMDACIQTTEGLAPH